MSAFWYGVLVKSTAESTEMLKTTVVALALSTAHMPLSRSYQSNVIGSGSRATHAISAPWSL